MNASSLKDQGALTPLNAGLEINAAPSDIVRLWVDNNRSNPDTYISALDRLMQYRGSGNGTAASAYRFLGVRRERKAGVDYLCISFCSVTQS